MAEECPGAADYSGPAGAPTPVYEFYFRWQLVGVVAAGEQGAAAELAADRGVSGVSGLGDVWWSLCGLIRTLLGDE